MDLSAYTGQTIELSFYEAGVWASYYVLHAVYIVVDGYWTVLWRPERPLVSWTNMTIDISAYAGEDEYKLCFTIMDITQMTGNVDYVTVTTSGTTTTDHVIAAGACIAGYSGGYLDVTLTPGTHVLRMEIDPDGYVDETDETNNIFERTITVTVEIIYLQEHLH
jgi:hypothetical protein